MRLVSRSGVGSSGDDDDVTCYICASSFCDDEACSRTLTHLACCTQSICCGCLLKMSKRCGCKEDCDAVISLCPFCREVSPVEALDVFLGTKPPCSECSKEDDESASVPVATTPAEDDDDDDPDDMMVVDED